jgi:hypothetical protein
VNILCPIPLKFTQKVGYCIISCYLKFNNKNDLGICKMLELVILIFICLLILFVRVKAYLSEAELSDACIQILLGTS